MEHICNCKEEECNIKLSLEWNQTYDGDKNKKGPILLFVDKDSKESLIYLTPETVKALIDDLTQGLVDLAR